MVPDISELTREARQADKVDRRRAELFAPMIKTEAWQEYVKLLEAKLQALSDQLLAPASNWDGLVASEWIKGAMSGLITARDIPSATIGAMEELRRTGLAPAEDEDDG